MHVGTSGPEAHWLEAQLEDPDIRPMVEWLSASSEKTPWEEVTASSLDTKYVLLGAVECPQAR